MCLGRIDKPRWLVLLNLLFLGFAGCGSSVQALLGLEDTAAVCQTPDGSRALAEEVVALVNQERELRGLNPLIYDEQLSRFGSRYACTMIEDGFFGHDDPDTGAAFEDRHASSEYHSCYLGENLAFGYGSPEGVFEAWMRSPTHRENILDDSFVRIGLGVRQHSADQGLYWVEVFLGECDLPPAVLEPISGLSDDLSAFPSLPQGGSGELLAGPPPTIALGDRAAVE